MDRKGVKGRSAQKSTVVVETTETSELGVGETLGFSGHVFRNLGSFLGFFV